jgi:mannan endo-1,4-beta-mannosidase
MTSASFCKVEGTRLVLNGKNHFVYSANYWQAMNLGVRDEANKKGDRKRLLQDLDHLKKSGVNNLRVMAASEGPNSEPFRMTPALMNKPGDYDEDVLDGFDFAMAEISKRGLTAVVCFNNFWHWSGGFSQYVNWITSEPIPYPPSWSPELGDYTAGTSDENWQIFIDYANQFYTNPEVSKTAQKWYRDHISFILNRKNKYTGLYYKEDPTVLAFELCNEPQTPPPEWVEDTAKFIKSIAPNHLVTVGLESKFDQKEFDIAHKCPSIDYCTNHVWVQNRGVRLV